MISAAAVHSRFSWRSALWGIAALGAFAAAAGGFTAYERLWGNVLLAGFFVLSLCLGSMLFLAIQGAAGAEWSYEIHGLPRALAGALWVGCALVGAALLFGHATLFAWLHPSDPAAHMPHAQAFWLAQPFMLARAAVYFIVWGAFARAFARGASGLKISAGYIVAFAVTFSLASFDWLMALEPHWFSTMFAVYMFAGAFLAALAAVGVMAVLLRREGTLRGVLTDDHLHDLGKLTFGFATFWAYIWFCQFLLVWYTNIPEETTFFLRRHAGGWGALSAVNFLLHFLLPFFALMPRCMKRSETAILRVGLAILAGHALDLYITIMPRFSGASPSLAPWEIALFVGAVALFALAVIRHGKAGGQ